MTDKLSKLEKIRAQLQAQEKETSNKQSGPNPVFPFWNVNVDESSTVRFLPDGNAKNDLPWVESQTIRLSFPGILGQSPKSVEFTVPCVEMWGLQCPILGYVRKNKWFDSTDTEALGRQYWKKRKWIFQGFVVSTDLNEEEKPENPIRRFVIGKQIFDIIKASFLDPELEASIDDFDEGIDFVIRKQQGSYGGNYSTSSFKRKPRSLSDSERDAVEEHGLSNLDEFLPKKPTDDELNTIFEMFEASVAGEFYDSDRWGHLPWRPYGLSSNSTETPKGKKVEDSKETETTETVVEEKKESPKKSATAEEILAKIRANKK